MLRRLDLPLRLGVSFGLVAFVLWRAGLGDVVAILGRISLAGGAVVILLHTGDRLLMVYKWRRLLLAKGVDVGFGEAARAYYVASFASIFLPLTIGADVVRVACRAIFCTCTIWPPQRASSWDEVHAHK